MKRIVWACAAVIGLWADPSAAQNLSPSGYFTYGSSRLAAIDSFEAITGSASQSAIGVGGRVDGLWRGVFADAAFSWQKLDGERVFITDGTVFPLGIATRITYRPLDFAAGWRFRVSRVRPYVGAGASIVMYQERSDFAEAGDDVDKRTTGTLLLAGVDVALLRHVRVGGELRYRVVTGILGAGGVSELFGEDELGGIAFAARVSVGR